MEKREAKERLESALFCDIGFVAHKLYAVDKLQTGKFSALVLREDAEEGAKEGGHAQTRL
jgi:hypothetical protein